MAPPIPRNCPTYPNVNPWPKWNAKPFICDFCLKDHEPRECGSNKPCCGKCGHGWHSRQECLLKPFIDSHLEQFTRYYYKIEKEKQDKRPPENRLIDQQEYHRRMASVSDISGPSISGSPSGPQPHRPTAPGTAARPSSNFPSSRPEASSSLADPSTARPSTGSSMDLSKLKSNLPSQSSQSSHSGHPSQSQGQSQGQPQSQPSSGSREERQRREKAEAAIKNTNREKWTEASLSLTGYPRQDQIPRPGNNKIKANFFEVSISNPIIDLRRYHVEFRSIPTRDRNGIITYREVVKPDLKRAMITQMLATQPPDAKYYATDYFFYIISVGRLYDDCGDEINNRVIRTHTLTSADTTLDPLNMSIVIVYDRRVDLAELRRFVDRDPQRNVSYHPGEDLKALNIVSWQRIFPNTFLGGRVGNKFYPNDMPRTTVNAPYVRGGPLWDLRSGFFSSMRPGDRKLLLNVNCTTSAFFHNGLLQNWISAKFGNSIATPARVLRELRGVKVSFRGDTNNPKKKRAISGIDAQPVNLKTFTQNGQIISVWRHMSNTYGQHQQDCSQDAWCVNVGNVVAGEEIWYPADMLQICAWQPAGKKAGTEITDPMLRMATKRPRDNLIALRNNAVGTLGIRPLEIPTAPEHYTAFGVNVSSTPLVLERTRRLVAPPLRFRDPAPTDDDIVKGTNANPATWALTQVGRRKRRGPQGFAIVNNDYPTLYVISIGTKHENAVGFMDTLSSELRSYGFATREYLIANVVRQAPTNPNPQFRRRDMTTTLNRGITILKNRGGNIDPPLVVILLPNKKKGDPVLYSDVKWWGDCVSGIPTVCVSEQAIFKGYRPRPENRQPHIDHNMMANIALKINFKLGGTSHRVMGMGVKDGTMIMGADVTHVGKGQNDECPSQAGVVATRDQDHMHYLASARLQPHNTEFIEGLQGMVEERLEAYYQHNHSLPTHILFYRDGVGETQYGMVFEEELPQIEKACKAKAAKYNLEKPSITLLVVGKRHHARFFPPASVHDEASRYNLIAGTVVDRDVTDPNRTNFYLQSHDSQLGTARTGHYVVIIDESNYGLAELERVTNNICFTGSRATKALSVCTPAKYADILCSRLRCYMQPALVNPLLNGRTVDHYRQNNTVWGNLTGNPWHARVNNVMFYL